MAEEKGVLFLELPGMPTCGTCKKENIAILEEHRDMLIDIDVPGISDIKLTSEGSPFYVPKEKELKRSYSIPVGQEVHIWLSKHHKGTLYITCMLNGKSQVYSEINFAKEDNESYGELLARPAPIIVKAKPAPTESFSSAVPSTASSVPPLIMHNEVHKETLQKQLTDSPLDTSPISAKRDIMAACHTPTVSEEDLAIIRDMKKKELASTPGGKSYYLNKWGGDEVNGNKLGCHYHPDDGYVPTFVLEVEKSTPLYQEILSLFRVKPAHAFDSSSGKKNLNFGREVIIQKEESNSELVFRIISWAAGIAGDSIKAIVKYRPILKLTLLVTGAIIIQICTSPRDMASIRNIVQSLKQSAELRKIFTTTISLENIKNLPTQSWSNTKATFNPKGSGAFLYSLTNRYS